MIIIIIVIIDIIISIDYYICRKPPAARARMWRRAPWAEFGKGANGVSTNGVTANFILFDRDLLCTPVDLLLSPQKFQGVPFSLIRQNSLLLQRPH